jgi:large subunit ribosomal protein L18
MTKVNTMERRQRRIRGKIRVTAGGKLRLTVTRTGKHISAQVVDDVKGITLASATSMGAANKGAGLGGNIAAAAAIGKKIAETAKKAGVTQVVFDRSGYLYHGRVKALAEAAREGGLQF